MAKPGRMRDASIRLAHWALFDPAARSAERQSPSARTGPRHGLAANRALRFAFCNSRGFTLIELLIATVVISLLMLALYHAYAGAMDTWNRTQADLTYIEDGRRSVVAVSTELSSLARPPIKDVPALTGTSRAITFFTRSDAGEYGAQAAGSMTKVTYSADGSRLADPDDLPRLTLTRTRQFYSGNTPVSAPAGSPLLTGAADVRFEYLSPESLYGQEKWLDYWVEAEQLPLAVRVTISIYRPAGRGKPQQVERLSTTAMLPVFGAPQAAQEVEAPPVDPLAEPMEDPFDEFVEGGL